MNQPETVSVRALSDALAALGAYAEPPTDADLAAAIEAEGEEALTARLANALYGVALAHVLCAEYAAEAGTGDGYRAEAWRAAGATSEGTAMLLLEVCTVRTLDDPRAGAVTTNLSRAVDQLGTAADRIDNLFAAGRDVAAIITPPRAAP